ncbi:MAG: STAS domain-containing protein [Candidatus Kapabacteria bacterium]|nr:STAS domain-containing protein [Ignavibacteriota bacterium]MCW5885069.1 STAS domain-containing protein [Candidatus Kapabacteria bacterium]
MSEDIKFDVKIKYEKEVVCMYLKGFLDAHTASELENAIQSTISEGKYKILMNFEQLDYISSAGLGVFMSFIEEIRNKNGDIKMSNMSDKVFSVFDLLGFPMLFDIDKDEEICLQKFYENKIKE